MEQKSYALVLGSSVNGLSVVRSLGRKGLRVVVLDRGRPAGPASSRYIDAFEEVGFDISEEATLDKIEKVGSRYPKPIFLFPTNDYFVLLVSKHQERFKRNFVFTVASAEVQENIVNKKKLYELAERIGVPCPRTFSPRNREELIENLAHVRFPCFLKPVYSHLWRRKYKNVKLLEIANPEELIARFEEVHALGLEMMVQEIIPGGDDTIFSVFAYMDREGNPLVAGSKRKLRQNPIGKGDGCLQMTIKDEDLKNLGVKLLRGLGYVGPAIVEFRWDQREKNYKLMEINARTILGQELIARAGINVPWIAYEYSLGRKVKPVESYREGIKWICFELDFDSFLEGRRMGILTFWQWLRSLWGINAFAFFCWDDPVPFFVETAHFAGRLCRSVLNRALPIFANGGKTG